MRIAILHYTTPPVIGGVEQVIGDQAQALRALGHQVRVLNRAGEAADREAGSYEAIIVHNVFTMPFDLEWTRDLRKRAAAEQHIRWINWVHDVASVNPYYAHLPWEQPDYMMLSEAVPNTVTVTVSEARRQDYVRASGLPASSVQVIPNGVELAEILGLSPRIAGWQLWQHELVLFHPTRLLRRKNIELGIRVCAALHAAGCDALYAVTGATDPHQADGICYLQELTALADDLNVAEHVRFLSQDKPLTNDDVRGLYNLADCLFFPSKGEGFGLPLLEALVHRLPVFCSDLPVHREVVGDHGNYFMVDAPPEHIASQLIAWARTETEIARRRWVWGRHEMIKICQERLEPLLRMGNGNL